MLSNGQRVFALLLSAAILAAPLTALGKSSSGYAANDFIGSWTCNVHAGGYTGVFDLTTPAVGTTYSHAAGNAHTVTDKWSYSATGPTTGVANETSTTVEAGTGKTARSVVHYTWLSRDHISETYSGTMGSGSLDCTRAH